MSAAETLSRRKPVLRALPVRGGALLGGLRANLPVGFPESRRAMLHCRPQHHSRLQRQDQLPGLRLQCSSLLVQPPRRDPGEDPVVTCPCFGSENGYLAVGPAEAALFGRRSSFLGGRVGCRCDFRAAPTRLFS